MPSPSTTRRQCDLPGCSNSFTILEAAPHKRFCCQEHRNAYHAAELKLARARLRADREGQSPTTVTREKE